MTGKASIPSAPPAPRRRQLTAIESWYLECWRNLAKHLKRPPSIAELATYCNRSHTPAYLAMIRLEAKGYLIRDAGTGRFEAVS